ncbi:MAG: IS1096 element passenger TnpR family protein [Bacteroidales bacterium]
MLIYRFRVTCEEHDGFLREIEIQPNQTFLDFHHILLDSGELLHCDRASFFMTDKKYKKDKEISLKAEKRQVRKYDEDLDQVVTEALTLPLMKTEKIKNYIEDPHQKMIYEFIGRDIFSFHIELFKIFPAEGVPSFPRCIKRVGELPKKAEQPTAAEVVPAAPKVVIPKVPLPKLQELVKFDDIVEDEHELAEIENELVGLLEDDQEQEVPSESNETDEHGMNDFLYGEEEEADEDDKLDHLEDYEDIESLDKRISGFDRDSDDY